MKCDQIKGYLRYLLRAEIHERFFFEKMLAISIAIVYHIKCCDMIAMKREVAVGSRGSGGFPWSEGHVRN